MLHHSSAHKEIFTMSAPYRKHLNRGSDQKQMTFRQFQWTQSTEYREQQTYIESNKSG